MFPFVGLVLFFVPIATTHAGGMSDEERARTQLLFELSMADREYRVAVASVVHDPAETGEELVLESYARILRDAVLEVPRRYLSDEERRAIRERRIADELRTARLNRERRRQDLERASIRTPEAVVPVEREEDRSFLDLTQRIELLDAIKPEEVTLSPVIPIALVNRDTALQRRSTDPAAAADDLNVDLLFTIGVEDLGELRMITIGAYLAAIDREEVLGRVIAEPENLPQRFEAQLPAVLNALSVRELAAIAVRVVAPDGHVDGEARIRINERLVGVGEAEEGFLPAGEYTVSAERTDGRRVAERFAVGAGERYVLTLQMPALTTSRVTIISRPAGAAVYEGALWRGYTPMQLPLPTRQVEYRIVREGSYESRVSIGPESPALVERTLIGTEYDWEMQVESDRLPVRS